MQRPTPEKLCEAEGDYIKRRIDVSFICDMVLQQRMTHLAIWTLASVCTGVILVGDGKGCTCGLTLLSIGLMGAVIDVRTHILYMCEVNSTGSCNLARVTN